MPRINDLTGAQFGLLTVIGRGENIGRHVGWSCECSCGSGKLISARADQLRKGLKNDCGCLKEQNREGIYGPFIDRKQAQLAGLTQYYPGSKCPKGHVSPRWTNSGSCIECHKLSLASLRNEGYFLEYERARRENDPEWRLNKAKIARESYSRRKDDPEFRKRIRLKVREQMKSALWQEQSRAAKARYAASGKKAEADKRYAQTSAGQESHAKARQAWRERFEESVGMPISTHRMQTDPQFKLHVRLNTRIRDSLKDQGVSKDEKTAHLLGMSIGDFRSYISENWSEGMTWANYGRHGWHIDHIRPCASFDLTDIEQQSVCFNWRNLTPMWGAENIRKSDRYDPEDEADWIEMMRGLGHDGHLFPLYAVEDPEAHSN